VFEGLFQPTHLLLILIIVLIIFGPGKLPEMGSSLGKAMKDFKKAMTQAEKEPDESAKKIEGKKDDPQ
jgi:sec-independent protein translocase protein TatA